MRLLLIGYGKMGKLIEQKAKEQGHQIMGIIRSNNIDELDGRWKNNIDCAIEFTTPSVVVSNILQCLKHDIPVVTGTTGWEENATLIFDEFKKNNGALFYASNFSIGANILFKLNRYLAKIMSHHKQYNLQITEIHHLEKKDNPSGTAITIANDIISSSERTKWSNLASEDPKIVSIISERINKVAGTHIINYSNSIDEISIEHKAKNRDGFVNGALVAAEYLASRKGIYTMADII